MRLSLYQPEIPQNVGALIRTAACFSFKVDIIHPCGFPIGSKQLKRSALDYAAHLDLLFHADFSSYRAFLGTQGRLILLTTKTNKPYTAVSFQETDCIMVGRESSGVPDSVHQSVDESLTIPIHAACRSMNVAIAASIVMAEMRRQLPL